jgi:hypothetical protein
MSPWNTLLKALDQALGFPNKVESRVNKVRQGFDQQKNEHVFQLEYRVRVDRGATQGPKPQITKKQTRSLMQVLDDLAE